MSNRPDTWMPFYIGAYLADTMHLTRDQHGAYILLIMAYWRRGEALPSDDNQLAAIAKATPGEWRKLRQVIAPFFREEDGKWWHKRIDSELEKASAKRDERSKSGAAGAKKRWQNDGKAIAEPLANASQNDAPLPTNPSSSLRSEEETGAPAGARASVKKDFEEWWGAYPHKIGKGAAEPKYIIARKSVDRETLLAGVERYKTAKPADIPWVNPATWLHQKRWEDQPSFVQNGHDKGEPVSNIDILSDFWRDFPDPSRVIRDAQWAARLREWAERPKSSFWPSHWGPRPDHPDCQAPVPMLKFARQRALELSPGEFA